MVTRCLLLMLFLCAGCQTREKVEPLSDIRMEARMTSPTSPSPARGKNESAPKLRVAWEPASDLAFVSLNITNEGTRPASVNPQMEFTLGDLADDPRIPDIAWPLVDEAGIIQVVLISAESNGQPCGWKVILARPSAWPVVLAPGETRKVKVSVDGYAMNRADKSDGPDRVVFALRYNGKELARHAVVKRGGPRQRWRSEAALSDSPGR